MPVAGVSTGKIIGFQIGAERAEPPVRSPETIRRYLTCGAGHRQPFPVHFVRTPGIDKNVTVPVVRSCALQTHFLMPAVHTADRIRLNGEGQILMNTSIFPPDAFGIGVSARIRFDPMHLAHLPP